MKPSYSSLSNWNGTESQPRQRRITQTTATPTPTQTAPVSVSTMQPLFVLKPNLLPRSSVQQSILTSPDERCDAMSRIGGQKSQSQTQNSDTKTPSKSNKTYPISIQRDRPPVASSSKLAPALNALSRSPRTTRFTPHAKDHYQSDSEVEIVDTSDDIPPQSSALIRHVESLFTPPTSPRLFSQISSSPLSNPPSEIQSRPPRRSRCYVLLPFQKYFKQQPQPQLPSRSSSSKYPTTPNPRKRTYSRRRTVVSDVRSDSDSHPDSGPERAVGLAATMTKAYAANGVARTRPAVKRPAMKRRRINSLSSSPLTIASASPPTPKEKKKRPRQSLDLDGVAVPTKKPKITPEVPRAKGHAIGSSTTKPMVVRKIPAGPDLDYFSPKKVRPRMLPRTNSSPTTPVASSSSPHNSSSTAPVASSSPPRNSSSAAPVASSSLPHKPVTYGSKGVTGASTKDSQMQIGESIHIHRPSVVDPDGDAVTLDDEEMGSPSSKRERLRPAPALSVSIAFLEHLRRSSSFQKERTKWFEMDLELYTGEPYAQVSCTTPPEVVPEVVECPVLLDDEVVNGVTWEDGDILDILDILVPSITSGRGDQRKDNEKRKVREEDKGKDKDKGKGKDKEKEKDKETGKGKEKGKDQEKDKEKQTGKDKDKAVRRHVQKEPETTTKKKQALQQTTKNKAASSSHSVPVLKKAKTGDSASGSAVQFTIKHPSAEKKSKVPTQSTQQNGLAAPQGNRNSGGPDTPPRTLCELCEAVYPCDHILARLDVGGPYLPTASFDRALVPPASPSKDGSSNKPNWSKIKFKKNKDNKSDVPNPDNSYSVVQDANPSFSATMHPSYPPTYPYEQQLTFDTAHHDINQQQTGHYPVQGHSLNRHRFSQAPGYAPGHNMYNPHQQQYQSNQHYRPYHQNFHQHGYPQNDIQLPPHMPQNQMRQYNQHDHQLGATGGLSQKALGKRRAVTPTGPRALSQVGNSNSHWVTPTGRSPPTAPRAMLMAQSRSQSLKPHIPSPGPAWSVERAQPLHLTLTSPSQTRASTNPRSYSSRHFPRSQPVTDLDVEGLQSFGPTAGHLGPRFDPEIGIQQAVDDHANDSSWNQEDLLQNSQQTVLDLGDPSSSWDNDHDMSAAAGDGTINPALLFGDSPPLDAVDVPDGDGRSDSVSMGKNATDSARVFDSDYEDDIDGDFDTDPEHYRTSRGSLHSTSLAEPSPAMVPVRPRRAVREPWRLDDMVSTVSFGISDSEDEAYGQSGKGKEKRKAQRKEKDKTFYSSKPKASTSSMLPIRPVSSDSEWGGFEEDRVLTTAKTSTAPPTARRRGGAWDTAWPTNATQSSCHACRNTSNRKYMTCSFCDSKYCVRCLVVRFDGIVFDDQSRNFECPKCQKLCNCTFCSKKAGKQYISTIDLGNVKFGSDATSVPQSNIERAPTKVKAISKPPIVRPAGDSAPPANRHVWGAVYSIHLGHQIGTAYQGDNLEEGIDEIWLERDPDADAKAKPRRTVRPRNKAARLAEARAEEMEDEIAAAAALPPRPRTRTYFGKIQPHWNLGEKPVKRLASPVRRGEIDPDNFGGARAGYRLYIGNPKMLSLPQAKSAEDDEEDDDDDDEGEREDVREIHDDFYRWDLRSLSPLTPMPASPSISVHSLEGDHHYPQQHFSASSSAAESKSASPPSSTEAHTTLGALDAKADCIGVAHPFGINEETLKKVIILSLQSTKPA